MENRLNAHRSAQLVELTRNMELHGLVPGRSPLYIPSSARAGVLQVAQDHQEIESIPLSTSHRSHLRRNPSFSCHKTQARQYRLQLWYLSRLLVVTFQSNRGAGGFSISASLQLNGVVFENRPFSKPYSAYTLTNGHVSRSKSLKTPRKISLSCMRTSKLHQVIWMALEGMPFIYV